MNKLSSALLGLTAAFAVAGAASAQSNTMTSGNMSGSSTSTGGMSAACADGSKHSTMSKGAMASKNRPKNSDGSHGVKSTTSTQGDTTVPSNGR